jgi:hypothetical protein
MLVAACHFACCFSCFASMQTLAAEPADENLIDFSEAAKTIPKPREIWPILKEEHVVPIEFTDQVGRDHHERHRSHPEDSAK